MDGVGEIQPLLTFGSSSDGSPHEWWIAGHFGRWTARNGKAFSSAFVLALTYLNFVIDKIFLCGLV